MKKSSRFKRRFACVVAAAFLFAGAFFAPRAEIAASAETFAAETIAQPIQGEGPPTIPGKEAKGLFSSILGRWRKKYKCKIELAETTDFTVLQNEFYNEKGDKLD